MAKKIAATLLLLMFFSIGAAAQDAKTVVQNALKAMGPTNLKTLQFTGSGSQPAQLMDGNTPGPRGLIKSYVYTVDYTIPASRLETATVGGLPPQTQLGGEGHGMYFVNGEYAWDVNGITGVGDGGQRPSDWPILPLPASFTKRGDPMRTPNGDGLASHPETDRTEQIWLTPHGFLLGALKGNATWKQETIGGKKFDVVTWTGPNEQKINGYIDPEHMVTKVETWIDHPMYGDEHVVRDFSYFKDFGGIVFPAHIVETITTPALTGEKSRALELFITEVKANVSADFSVPEAVRQTPPAPAVTIINQKLGDGLYYIAGQNDYSLAVEFKDFVTVVEGPMNDARSVAVIAEVHKLIPNKPICYMVNTHPHVDHTGGVRGYAAIGATIITQQANVPFIEALLRTPHTIIPDSLSKSPNAKFHVEGVEESRTITDGTRKLELYHMRGSSHSSGMLMTYLPAEKILTEGDPWTPGMVKVKPTDRPSQRCCDSQNLYENIKRLNLDVKTFAPIHGRTATWDEFVKYVDYKPEVAEEELAKEIQGPARGAAGGQQAQQGQPPAMDLRNQVPLFFREDWKKKAGLTANEDHQLTQADVANANLELKMYGDTANLMEIFQAPIDVVMAWTGHCATNCAVALRDKNNYVDLTGLAKVRWRTRQSGFHYLRPIVKLADGTWLIGDHADGYTVDWTVSEFSFYDLHWRRLDIGSVVEARDGLWVDRPDLSKVDEVGFTDLMSGSGAGQGGSSRVDWIEVYGKPVSREANPPRSSAQAR